jgi:hypothetical protein
MNNQTSIHELTLSELDTVAGGWAGLALAAMKSAPTSDRTQGNLNGKSSSSEVFSAIGRQTW